MRQQDDWRLTGQEKFLKGVQLRYENFRKFCPNKDHGHCIFCTKKLMKENDYGYCTINGYHWICEECYEDFNNIFDWKVIRIVKNNKG